MILCNRGRGLEKPQIVLSNKCSAPNQFEFKTYHDCNSVIFSHIQEKGTFKTLLWKLYQTYGFHKIVQNE